MPFADRIVPARRADGPLTVGEPGERAGALAGRTADRRARPAAPAGTPLPLTVRDARRRASGSALAAGAAGPWPRRRPPAVGARRTRRDGRPRPRTSRSGTSTSTCRPAQVTALMGRNGSGKSSLLWALQGTGKRRSRHGARRAGRATRPSSAPADRRALVGLVPQTAADLLYLETVDEECAAADSGAGAQRGLRAPCSTGSCPASTRRPHPRDLSEGQRLALALAVVLDREAAGGAARRADPRPRLPRQGARSPSILATLAADGHAVLVATHDVEFVAQVADRVVVLADGRGRLRGPDRRVVAESPAFAPQVHQDPRRRRGSRVDQVVAAGVRDEHHSRGLGATRAAVPRRLPVPCGRQPCWRSPRSPG